MTIFWLKIIACVTMIIDHIKYAFPSTINEITMYGGRIAFPIFAFCAVEGYVHTSDFSKYLKRLVIFALISQIPFMLFSSLPLLNGGGLNVLFTILLGIMAIKLYESSDKKFIGILAVIGCCFLRRVFKN